MRGATNYNKLVSNLVRTVRRAAEQRSALSQGEASASPGSRSLSSKSRGAATENWRNRDVGVRVAPPGLETFLVSVAQGSQILALGLALIAAPPLRDYRTSRGYF